jgi:hypothetical protein
LRATRRQIVIRFNLQRHPDLQLTEILATMDAEGFDGICRERGIRYGNLIVGNRRGTDAVLALFRPSSSYLPSR